MSSIHFGHLGGGLGSCQARDRTRMSTHLAFSVNLNAYSLHAGTRLLSTITYVDACFICEVHACSGADRTRTTTAQHAMQDLQRLLMNQEGPTLLRTQIIDWLSSAEDEMAPASSTVTRSMKTDDCSSDSAITVTGSDC
jgi:hypothetical protein